MRTKTSTRPVSIHSAAQRAVNTPPSRNPILMRHLYELMLRCRSLQLPARGQRQGEASVLGQEAMLAGALAGILPEDILTISRTQAAIEIALGIPQKHEPVPAKSRRGSRLPQIVELAADATRLLPSTQIHLSAGVAIAKRQEPGVVLAFCGDTFGLREAGTVLELAGRQKLPLVIVTEHNMAAKSTPRHRRTADLASAARKYGVPGMTVDGSDVMAVYRVTQEALYRARHNGGPTLVECKTWRPTGRKILSAPPQRLRHWVQGDPLEYMEKQLKVRGFWDAEWAEGLDRPSRT